MRPGHTLIIPKQHYPYFEDMPAAGHILNLGQKLGRHMKRLYGVDRVGFAFTGIHVAHAHAHVIPMHDPQDVTSTQYIVQKDLTFTMPPQAPQEGRRPPPNCAANCTASRRAPAEGRRVSPRTNKGRSEDLPLSHRYRLQLIRRRCLQRLHRLPDGRPAP